MVEHHIHSYYVLWMTVNVTFALIVMLGACLCCKKKAPKNDLLGLDGMVKLKNPDEDIVKLNVFTADAIASNGSAGESDKRCSVAAHRSLPDIPVTDSNELYESVTDPLPTLSKHESPISTLKKQSSISQHSSMSQADDVSSPYSRVKNSEHDYAKVLNAEHPYARLNLPSSIEQNVLMDAENVNQDVVRDGSPNLNPEYRTSENSNASQSDIPAASAIAGMISASQDLPYMTPPIATLHFSGDSQDSSKGYTSISVREPIANILALQPPQPIIAKSKSPDVSDSHYATVSDDSDETYAAIADPNLQNNINMSADMYTSGSETYAQIQPQQLNTITVSVEINNATSGGQRNRLLDQEISSIGHIASHANRTSMEHSSAIISLLDDSRDQTHSRQISSSSINISSLGIVSSPKPEKRQANSPLPPTPKSNIALINQMGEPNVNIASTKESLNASLDIGFAKEAETFASRRDTSVISLDEALQQTTIEPSDIEVMYAKVNKRNKNSRYSVSPQHIRNLSFKGSNEESEVLHLIDDDNLKTVLVANGGIPNKKSTDVIDHGYETIPNIETIKKHKNGETSDAINFKQLNKDVDKRPEEERLDKNVMQHTATESDCDPNYEELKNSITLSDDGYAKVKENILEKEDGYSKIQHRKVENTTVHFGSTDANHNYESISESKTANIFVSQVTKIDCDVDHYSNINEGSLETSQKPLESSLKTTTSVYEKFNQFSKPSKSLTTTSSKNSDNVLQDDTDPNYESLSNFTQPENHYEHVHQNPSTSIQDIPTKEETVKNTLNDAEVHDFFQV